MNILEADWVADSKGFWLKFRIEKATEGQELVEKISSSDRPFELQVEEKFKKRSLEANSLFWLLLNKLAAKTRIPTDELYHDLVRRIGDNNEIVCVKNEALDRLKEVWKAKGLGWCTDTFESKIPGCTNVVLYYGSSQYDSKQMSRLLDMVIEECEAQGIPTAPPEEVQRLKEEWK